MRMNSLIELFYYSHADKSVVGRGPFESMGRGMMAGLPTGRK